MYTIFVFFVALGVLIIVHEWGHYIVAKLSGVWVEKFSIGFGPKIIGFTKNNTDYRIAPIPLGGYVKLYGQDPLEEAEGDLVKAEEIARDPRSFHSKSMPKKLATVFAGPVMNLVLCLILMPLVFVVGRLQPKILDEKPVLIDIAENSPAEAADLQKGDLILSFNGQTMETWNDLLRQIYLHPNKEVTLVYARGEKTLEKKITLSKDKSKKQIAGDLGINPFALYGNEPVIGIVNQGSAAEKAGLKIGDQVLSIDKKTIKYWSEIPDTLEILKDKPFSMTVKRDNHKITLFAQASFDKTHEKYLLGVSKTFAPDLLVKKRYGFVEAVQLGTLENLKLTKLLGEVLQKLFTGDLSYKSLGGPIQIAKATSIAAKSGFGEFLYLLAFLSLQLGILNLLPIPVLDGGHVAFMLVEAVIRRPISPKIRQVSTQIGMFALLALMVIITINDIDTVWGFSNILESLKSLF